MPKYNSPFRRRIANGAMDWRETLQSFHSRLGSGTLRFSNAVALRACWRPGSAALAQQDQSQQRARLVIHSMLIILFGILHAADGVVTYLGLKFAKVDEVNPLLNYVADFLGLGFSIFMLKLACIAVIAFLFTQRRRIKSCWSTAALTSAVYFYCWVVGNNVVLVSAT